MDGWSYDLNIRHQDELLESDLAEFRRAGVRAAPSLGELVGEEQAKTARFLGGTKLFKGYDSFLSPLNRERILVTYETNGGVKIGSFTRGTSRIVVIIEESEQD